MKKEKGFTLIELLAVIIILAIIALISVPLVLNIIEKAKKSAFKDSAYGIMESAKLYYVENIIDNKELGDKVFSYEEEEKELNYSGTRPKGGTVILKSDGKIKMSIHNGKWCAIKEEKEQQIKIIDYNEKNCEIEAPIISEGVSVEKLRFGLASPIPGSYYNIKNQKGTITCINLSANEKEVTSTWDLKEGENEVECRMIENESVITSLKRTFKMIKTPTTIEEIMKNNAEVLALDPDKNPRFVGANPKNYVTFGNDLYRIIGTFNNQMKIIYWGTKENPGIFYGNAIIQFDPNASNGGHGTDGYNDWAQAKLKDTLNTEYWNTIPIGYQNMVDQNYVWNIGGPSNISQTRSEYYITERSTTKSPIMNSHVWTGKIGLMYPSDYGYATNGINDVCEEISMAYWHLNEETKTYCSDTNYNWLVNRSGAQWTMTAVSDNNDNVTAMVAVGAIGNGVAVGRNFARPVMYLNSNVKIVGKGTIEEPFELSL